MGMTKRGRYGCIYQHRDDIFYNKNNINKETEFLREEMHFTSGDQDILKYLNQKPNLILAVRATGNGIGVNNRKCFIIKKNYSSVYLDGKGGLVIKIDKLNPKSKTIIYQPQTVHGLW